LAHLYTLENFLHFSLRQIRVWWQLGQWKWVALSPGFTGRLHELHSGRLTVACDISLEPHLRLQI
jgi:hypothetical protein